MKPEGHPRGWLWGGLRLQEDPEAGAVSSGRDVAPAVDPSDPTQAFILPSSTDIVPAVHQEPSEALMVPKTPPPSPPPKPNKTLINMNAVIDV